MFYFHINTSSKIKHASTGKYIGKPNFVHPTRCISTNVLFLGTEGEVSMRIEDRKYTLKRGSFMLLPAQLEHAGTEKNNSPLSYYWCHFNVDGAYLSESKIPLENELVIPEFGETSAYKKLHILFRELTDCVRNPLLPEFARVNESASYLSIILHEIHLSMQGGTQSRESRTAFINYVCQWIEKNASEITADDVAKAFPYNRDYLTRIFKKATGYTVAAYINKCKLENVKQLLLDTNLTAREIAFRCGFSDDKRMIKLFKAMFSVTTKEYRNAFKNLHINK